MSNKQDLFNEVKRLSKQANQRLVRLEKVGANTPALRKAKYNIEVYLGRNNDRFKYGKKMSYNELQKEKRAINQFLNSESSTVAGMNKVIESRLGTFKEEFGRDINTMTNIYQFLNSKEYKKLINELEYPSKVVVQAITKFKGDFNELSEVLNNSMKNGGNVIDDLNYYIKQQNRNINLQDFSKLKKKKKRRKR